MDFKEATDRLTECATLKDIAERSGMSEATIRRARLNPTSSSYRKPPGNWREVVARLARERGGELSDLADQLASKEP